MGRSADGTGNNAFESVDLRGTGRAGHWRWARVGRAIAEALAGAGAAGGP